MNVKSWVSNFFRRRGVYTLTHDEYSIIVQALEIWAEEHMALAYLIEDEDELVELHNAMSIAKEARAKLE